VFEDWLKLGFRLQEIDGRESFVMDETNEYYGRRIL